MAPMSRIPKRVRCSVCKKAWATLGLPSNLSAQFVRDGSINQKTKDIFRFVFGKKKAGRLRTTKDIDAAFADFTKRYPHLAPGYKRGEHYDVNSAADMKKLGNPGEISRDPFPRERIREERGMNPERRVM